MLSAYPACFFKEEGGYSVIFPDLNYLATCGETFEEALTAAVDCLAGYLFTLKKDGEEIPAPSQIGDIDIVSVAGDCEVSPDNGLVNVVTVDVEEYAKRHFEKAVKKTLTIPYWLNEAAKKQNINFSAVLQQALIEKIG